ncbi:hypothetical protein SPI_09288 [Niveomyces insectorum RCEF 264]|uniref:Uncharacterized protein n=1 Tax=Niveomyces insectorum RCEF 264 TaxID=1081102 RepID=A0A167LVT2_9HYPO|nr:hypothetical protein SPI_09288 [Niveomyces insectorum RCEF 264]
MAPNKVVTSAFIKNVVVGGRTVVVKYATETSNWRRVFLDQGTQDNFAAAVEKANIPEGATVAIMTETDHPSDKDSYTHFTTVFQKTNGDHVTTGHVYP